MDLMGQHGGGQQLLHPAKPRGEGRQHRARRHPQKEACGDPHQGSRRCSPEIRCGINSPEPGQHPQRRNQDDLLVDRHSAQLPKEQSQTSSTAQARMVRGRLMKTQRL